MRMRIFAAISAAVMSLGVALVGAPASASARLRFEKLVAQKTVAIHFKSARLDGTLTELCTWKLYVPSQFGNPTTYAPEGPGSLVEGSLLLDCKPYPVEEMWLNVFVQHARPGTDPTLAYAGDGWNTNWDSDRKHIFDGNDNIIHGTHVCSGDELWAYRTRGTADVLYNGIWYPAGVTWYNGLARKYFC